MGRSRSGAAEAAGGQSQRISTDFGFPEKSPTNRLCPFLVEIGKLQAFVFCVFFSFSFAQSCQQAHQITAMRLN